MMSWRVLMLSLVVLWGTACGSKKPTESAEPKAGADTGAEAEQAEDQKEAVESAKKKIQTWLSTDLAQKLSDMGKTLGKEVGLKLASNPEVMKKAKGLSGVVFKDKKVKADLKKIEEKATSGLGNKIKLGAKAIFKYKGIDNYKKKVGEDAQRVGTEVITAFIQEDILKDERTAALLKGFAPVVKMQGQIAAVSLQENLSPEVTKQLVGIAFRLVSAGKNPEMADRVDAWIHECESDVDPKIESLVQDVSALPSVEKAVLGLATEVLDHPRTKKELLALTNRLIADNGVNEGLVKVYEAAAFEKGDPAIQAAIEKVLALPVVDKEIFATLESLAGADGAGPMIGKHLTTVTEDPKLAAVVEDFVISVLETCGDPSNM